MLKSLFTLLLSKFFKKTDLDFIVGQVMPDGWHRRIVVKESAMGNFTGNYTAPMSGYFCIDGGNAIRYISINGTVHSRIEVTNGSLQWPEIFVVAVKGATLNYEVISLSGQTQGTSVYFVPSTGTPS